ncbi:hypothetical protein AVEN_252865-1 [Araneus ventricosus]|uniref:Uncharacterized protein n=1 Tax=Araneus ventricosus TaxID=182803 RepID=A0A4Y2U9E9_ARAVE|nr:hypothetical protein AVEN_252865-1 [Araneus ventricosus]
MLNSRTCTSGHGAVDLRTVTGVPLCACTRNVSRESHVPQSLSRSMWFQHDRTPPNNTIDVRQHLNVTFGQHWIVRGGPVHWPARSPDLSCLVFFRWDQKKTLVCETPVDSIEDVVGRISVAVGEMRDTPGIFQNVLNSLWRRCEACVTASC